MNLFEKGFNEISTNEDIHKYKIKINIIGRHYLFPKKVQEKIKKVIDITKDYNNYKINIALAYGGREEILDAVKKVAEKIKNKELDIKDVNEYTFAENLYMNTEPDLIIRTGGDRRTSNFLPWQSIYSEWFFLEKMWPEFEKEDLVKVIEEYKQRQRRFGK
ncbi:di-trans,poly-cis-decaprenylcistransferase [Candidatus Woesearchaeota archaeon CG_4_10_14_0_2_um_filter_33_10]|nr:MAG: di-trans,poly-cis-decaprenylcistransferase [Candidatus Woesearchaeota archaeon CG_4_10_14_0_2_um_filter_33_10]